jgi:Cu/Ag efflux pump CusA
VIAETVATPLEEAINGVENMMYMKSVAGSDGVLVTTVTFRPGTDRIRRRFRCKTGYRRPKRVCRKMCGV